LQILIRLLKRVRSCGSNNGSYPEQTSASAKLPSPRSPLPPHRPE
jgi:hypothetical protein